MIRLPATRSLAASVAAITALTAWAPVASADGFLDVVVDRARDALLAAAQSRRPVPPVPVATKWRPKNRGAAKLGAPLLALDATDLDGDGTAELLALTTRELLVLSRTKLGEVESRAPLPAAFAVVRSRDPIGAISVEKGAVVVRTSEQAVGARYTLESGALKQVEEVPGWSLCPGIGATRVPGRNAFAAKSLAAKEAWPDDLPRPTKPFYRVECRDYVAADGRPARAVAVTGEARVVEIRCQRDGGACPADAAAVPRVEAAGVAFEVADVDRDGRAEVIASRGQGPGRPDRVRVFVHDGQRSRLTFSKSFSGGVVAITALDLDGDGGLEVVAAVRVVDSLRVNLWTLNRAAKP